MSKVHLIFKGMRSQSSLYKNYKILKKILSQRQTDKQSYYFYICEIHSVNINLKVLVFSNVWRNFGLIENPFIAKWLMSNIFRSNRKCTRMSISSILNVRMNQRPNKTFFVFVVRSMVTCFAQKVIMMMMNGQLMIVFKINNFLGIHSYVYLYMQNKWNE